MRLARGSPCKSIQKLLDGGVADTHTAYRRVVEECELREALVDEGTNVGGIMAGSFRPGLSLLLLHSCGARTDLRSSEVLY